MQTNQNLVLSSKYLLVLTILLSACSYGSADKLTYKADFTAHVLPSAQTIRASLTISQTKHHLRQLDFYMPAAKFDNVVTNGIAQRDGDRLLVEVPTDGIEISWDVRQLSGRSPPDAQMTDSWALFKLEDVFPAAKVRSIAGAVSQSTLTLTGPSEWHFETAYGPVKQAALPLSQERNFNRPKGWLVAGELGIRRDLIVERRVAIAAPKGYAINRVELLSFLNWTLPAFVQVFPELPSRLLVVGAPAHLWRGGLSGYQSLYLHSERPLVSENATSPILHELAHVAGLHSATAEADWIVEGLAEYYSLEILHRSGGITTPRFEAAIDFQSAWATRENARLASPSSGANTAYAVVTFHKLAQELKASGASLDDVVQDLVASDAISQSTLTEVTNKHLGHASKVLFSALGRKDKK